MINTGIGSVWLRRMPSKVWRTSASMIVDHVDHYGHGGGIKVCDLGKKSDVSSLNIVWRSYRTFNCSIPFAGDLQTGHR